MSFNCLSSYMTHPLTTTLPAPVGQQFDKWQWVTCKANIPYGWLAQDGQTHLQEVDVVDSTSWCGKPLTLWFCVQSRRSESFNDKMWPVNYKGLLHWSWSPLFEKLVSNTLFRPQCNRVLLHGTPPDSRTASRHSWIWTCSHY